MKVIFDGCAFFAASLAFLSASLLTLKLWLASSFVIYNLCQIFIVENYYYDIKREFKLQNHFFILVRITFDKFCTYMANCTFWCGTMLSWRSSRTGVADRVVWGDIVVYVGGDVVLNVLGGVTMALCL